MAGIDDAVLRRRQLDLDKRTADLQAYFNRLARQQMAGMSSEWQIIDYRIKQQIKQIYKDMGAIQNPEKLKALQGKVERLEAYKSQIEADLARNLPAQQAYATGIIKHQFEKSYYMNAWALEQATKVTATVPVLTPAQVLGVLANPWLPDKATYSDRIRANTQLLARDMKSIIHQAVEDGTGWNEVARKISAKTGEGYFRAVRLARTEMNRAQALGQSYCYMQNQDVLDGKRWNATLDKKTAPKDADNDGKIYDLDYDTPGNPGVPGQRIPNHPNCRCIWSPTLSALGVSDKERIARDENGNRIYTKARTYREYAKERGLPDLDDRLVNDNLKQYLRPGESVADLNKTVKRWTYNGKTIQVPEPDWVAPPKTIPPIVQSKSGAKAVKPKVQSKPKPKRPVIVQKLSDVVNKYFTNAKVSDRRKMAQELLDEVGLNNIPVHIEMQRSRGYCSYDINSQPGVINVIKYSLESTDDRDDVYQVKTALHELFHAKNDGLRHDFVMKSTGFSFTEWTDIEETFAESAAHYLIRESGITHIIHPSYPEKLVRNLPRLKKLSLFRRCKTIDDFGKVMVKYRMIDKKDSLWQGIFDDMHSLNATWDVAQYARKNYLDYIMNNLDSLVDIIIENAPSVKPSRSLVLSDAKNVFAVVKNGAPAPIMGNDKWVFDNFLAAAMRIMGVK